MFDFYVVFYFLILIFIFISAILFVSTSIFASNKSLDVLKIKLAVLIEIKLKNGASDSLLKL